MANVEEENPQAAAERTRATNVVTQALRAQLPRFYINSFINALTDADIMTIAQCNGQTVCILNMNYTVAKSLIAALTLAIEGYENKFHTKVPDVRLSTIGSPDSPVTITPP
jgi:hypothetical protein